ncbi:hypothetical protein CSKR_113993 [Clonorchis sinensis]|uniref:Uncharacterized protein n=1 Tax=Clonorchis sinensis TaxID=79923 RepID=A0A3R7C7W9_CLOSI|nr:hypothetical protein CSKR_113993 [Clonorchis sinensis]
MTGMPPEGSMRAEILPDFQSRGWARTKDLQRLVVDQMAVDPFAELGNWLAHVSSPVEETSLLKILRQPTTGFALLGAHQVGAVPEFPSTPYVLLEPKLDCFREIHSFPNQFGFCERLTWNPVESPVCDVFRQLNVLHQAASCSSCYDIRDIHVSRYLPMRYLR